MCLCLLFVRGRQAGDTIAIWLPECSEKHVAQLAAARIGMVVADVDMKLASAEAVGSILEQSGAAVRGAGGGRRGGMLENLENLRRFRVIGLFRRGWGEGGGVRNLPRVLANGRC